MGPMAAAARAAESHQCTGGLVPIASFRRGRDIGGGRRSFLSEAGESARDEFRLRDTLRLEVTLLGGHERYAWRDARKFDDRELRDLVGLGMIGTGKCCSAYSARCSNRESLSFIREARLYSTAGAPCATTTKWHGRTAPIESETRRMSKQSPFVAGTDIQRHVV